MLVNFNVFISISPMGATPRSARSDHNVKSIDEEIEEDIQEDISIVDDFLKSDNSGVRTHVNQE